MRLVINALDLFSNGLPKIYILLFIGILVTTESFGGAPSSNTSSSSPALKSRTEDASMPSGQESSPVESEALEESFALIAHERKYPGGVDVDPLQVQKSLPPPQYKIFRSNLDHKVIEEYRAEKEKKLQQDKNQSH